jgi:2-amino-4-hydroxy-6-hydroxymethyldihydropteridine diphosphokinase
MYVTDQPAFLNAVVESETILSPMDLLRTLQSIEQALGRDPLQTRQRFGPRCIDLDIISYASITLSTPDLELPHPRLHEREFVLRPLCE